MDNILDIYTRLKFKIHQEISVTYYTNDGNKYEKDFILMNISLLPSICVNNNTELINIPFFSPNILIESITIGKQNKPIYFNPYISKFDNPFMHYKEMEEKIIDSNAFKLLGKREKEISRYLARCEDVTYDKLFFSSKQKEEFELFMNILIKELSEYAKKKGFNPNLKKICAGTTSIIYEIGDKIIKIGKPKRTTIIPYCEYLLQPIINRIFEFDGYPIHIEVTQKVLALDYEDGFVCYSEDERFNEIVSSLEVNLYSIGLSIDDLHPGNVGILLDDNKIHYDGITFDTANEEATSIKNNNNLKILPKGRYVIIDLDTLTIDNEKKYSEYLKSIGYNKDKVKTLKK